MAERTQGRSSASINSYLESQAAAAEQLRNAGTQAGQGVPLEVPLEKIRANPYQYRSTMDEVKLAELMAGIKANGLAQPVVVRPVADTPGNFELIVGHRRLEAFRKLREEAVAEGKNRWGAIQAVVRHASDADSAFLAFEENLKREDPPPCDIATGIAKIKGEFRVDNAHVAGRFGWELRKVERYAQLAEVSEELRKVFEYHTTVKKADARGQEREARRYLDITSILELLKLHRHLVDKKALPFAKATKKVTDLVKVAVDEDWGSRQVEEEVKDLIKGRKKPTAKPVGPVYFKEDEEVFSVYLKRVAEAPEEARRELRAKLQALLESLA